MKLYLDDMRPTPEGYIGCRWPDEVICHLLSGLVEEIDLDHDLGDVEAATEEKRKERTGMDVLTWIQRQVVQNLAGFIPPKMKIHSSNAAAVSDMRNTIKRIEELHREMHPDLYQILDENEKA